MLNLLSHTSQEKLCVLPFNKLSDLFRILVPKLGESGKHLNKAFFIRVCYVLHMHIDLFWEGKKIK